MDGIRAKFQCQSIKENFYHQKEVELNAVVTGSDENKSFSKFTPVGKMTMTVTPETEAVNFFEVGKEYYLDISLAE